jgi:hypothetical protein
LFPVTTTAPSLDGWIDGEDSAAPVRFDSQAEHRVRVEPLVLCGHHRACLVVLVWHAMTFMAFSLKQGSRWAVVFFGHDCCRTVAPGEASRRGRWMIRI